MEWIKTEDKLPEFGELVLVYCRIYGIFLASYELIGEFDGKEFGNWHDGTNLGILPPVYLMKIPEIPDIK